MSDPTSTRRRILDAALALFNERGPAGATTADIAAASGMREGNLHYHFNKKEQIVAALYEAFEAEVARTAEAPLGDPADPESYRNYQFGWFELMWRHRCFYRDGAALLPMSTGLEGRFAAVQRAAQARARAVLGQAVRHGLMAAAPAQIDALLHNVWIVSSYWMSYSRMASGAAPPVRDRLAWGFGQILRLYEPYLTQAGRSLARLPSPARMRSIVSGGGVSGGGASGGAGPPDARAARRAGKPRATATRRPRAPA